jgi:hypothetical protein
MPNPTAMTEAAAPVAHWKNLRLVPMGVENPVV